LAALLETRGELRRQAARRDSEQAKAPLLSDPASNEPPPGDLSSDQSSSDQSSSDQSLGDAQRVQQQLTPGRGRLDELFTRSQHYYLAGNWVDAERTLCDLLRQDRDDIEGKLLLAMVWRATDRRTKATRALRRLARREDAAAWHFEVEAELSRMAPEQPEEIEVPPSASLPESEQTPTDPPETDEPVTEKPSKPQLPGSESEFPLNRAA